MMVRHAISGVDTKNTPAAPHEDVLDATGNAGKGRMGEASFQIIIIFIVGGIFGHGQRRIERSVRMCLPGPPRLHSTAGNGRWKRDIANQTQSLAVRIDYLFPPNALVARTSRIPSPSQFGALSRLRQDLDLSKKLPIWSPT